jgi:hypothetical protein
MCKNYLKIAFRNLRRQPIYSSVNELWRLLRPGGYLYLTIHSRPLTEGLTPEERERFDAGELGVTYALVAGENLCSTFRPTPTSKGGCSNALNSQISSKAGRRNTFGKIFICSGANDILKDAISSTEINSSKRSCPASADGPSRARQMY